MRFPGLGPLIAAFDRAKGYVLDVRAERAVKVEKRQVEQAADKAHRVEKAEYVAAGRPLFTTHGIQPFNPRGNPVSQEQWDAEDRLYKNFMAIYDGPIKKEPVSTSIPAEEPASSGPKSTRLEAAEPAAPGESATG